MKFLSNTYNPTKPDSDLLVCRTFDQTQEEAIGQYRNWLRGKYIGRPQATVKYTVEELEAMDIVGVYDPRL